MENVKNEIILVTGVAGFIGSHIAEQLIKMGYKVRGLDNLSTGSLINIENLLHADSFEFILGDICDFDTCNKACTNVSYVLHEAALGSVPRSIKEPLEYTKNNIFGTHNMLEAAVKNGVKVFVYASSSSVYGDNNEEKKEIGKEGNVLSPYALTKRTIEVLAKLYYETYGLATIGLRYFNVFGERQAFNSQYSAVIPKFITSLIKNQKIIIHGDGKQNRDFTYVKNVVDANVKAIFANKDSYGQVFNVACGQTLTINELLDKIKRKLKKNIIEIEYLPKRKGDIKSSLADISKTKEHLNYNPIYNIDEGLDKTIKWYINENKGGKNYGDKL